jgi:hypothetical protein
LAQAGIEFEGAALQIVLRSIASKMVRIVLHNIKAGPALQNDQSSIDKSIAMVLQNVILMIALTGEALLKTEDI